jgi:hypothetical protein
MRMMTHTENKGAATANTHWRGPAGAGTPSLLPLGSPPFPVNAAAIPDSKAVKEPLS